MTMRSLLVRGMAAGLVAGILATAFAFTVGEPAIERAIAIEEQGGTVHSHGPAAAVATPGEPDAPPSISRGMQKTVGLVVGMLALGVAFGGVFAIVFALARGRLGISSDRGTALTVAALAFVAVALVPFLVYPANPPAVGHSATIAARTMAYVGALVVSVLLMVAAVLLQRMLAATHSAWDATILAGALFVVAAVAIALLLPAFSEVPAEFPADLLWQFRIASLGTQLTLWLGIGLAFGALTERATRRDA
ncbi:MAG: CbtA family protein [Dehalococcoidia bacterium]